MGGVPRIGTGVLLGTALGTLLGLLDPYLVWTRAPEARVLLPSLPELLARSVALLVPLLAVSLAVGALALGGLHRVWRRAAATVVFLLPFGLLLAVLAYGYRLELKTRGAVPPLALAKVVLVSLGVWGALWLALRGLARLRRREPGGTRRLGRLLAPFLLLWAAAAAGALLASRRPVLPAELDAYRGERPNVLLVVLDTVRADHLSCYGYGRKTTPRIDAWSQGATLYETCVSPAPWTLPAHASLFTGLPATTHGCDGTHQALDSRLETLAERLSSVGYQTLALSANPLLSASRGFDQGFDVFENVHSRWLAPLRPLADQLLERPGLVSQDAKSLATALHERLGRWFAREYTSQKPFFIFLNYIEAHHPYAPPSQKLRWADRLTYDKWRRRDQSRVFNTYALAGEDNLTTDDLMELQDLYDDEISYLDAKFGELLDFLDTADLARSTFVALTSDHGDHFGEHHLMDHLYSVYEPLVRVPLIVGGASPLPPGRRQQLVQTHDLFFTILAVAGVDGAADGAAEGPADSAVEGAADGAADRAVEGAADGAGGVARAAAAGAGDIPAAARPLQAAAPAPPRMAVSELLSPFLTNVATLANEMPQRDYSRFLRSQRAVRYGNLKLIVWSDGERQLYDLAADPEERFDRAAERPADVEAMAGRLQRWLTSTPHHVFSGEALPQGEGISEAEKKALRALGYAN